MSNPDAEILFNKFKIISCFKKNEYSAVYLANHIFLEKKVFLKILNTDTIADSSITERFKREAKILAKLDHPNIIKVFDFGMYEEYFYISFEFFASKNLREYNSKKDLSDEKKRKIFVQLAKGLGYAHKKNVIHRDIKPENILVNEDLELKLTDFGLALDTLNSFITQQYSVVGTTAYMAPEQIQGGNPSIKSDLFSLGITAYELFKNINPFLGTSANETINNIISYDEGTNKDFFTGFNEDIELILKGLLTSDPSARFDSCADILNILKIDTSNLQPDPIKKKRNWIFFFVFMIIASSIFLIYKLSNYSSMESQQLAPQDSTIIFSDTIESTDKILMNKDYDEAISGMKEVINSESFDSTEENGQEIVNETIVPDIQYDIKKEFGELYVKCYPWADLYLNGNYFETTPLSNNIRVETGKYLLNLTNTNYPTYADSIFISSENILFIEVNLDTLFGHLDCKVYPWGEVFIDENRKGLTPFQNTLKLHPGEHNLKILNPGYKSIDTLINILRNDTLKMQFNMVMK